MVKVKTMGVLVGKVNMAQPLKFHFNKASVRPDWADLPASRLLNRIPELEAHPKLTDLIVGYHALPKDDVKSLSKRCTALMKVALYIQKLETCNDAPEVLTDIQSIALRKRSYLQKLNKLFKDGILVDGEKIYDLEKVRSYFEDFKNIPEKQILLTNTVHYDSQSARFWGEYWLEVIDPCHRPLEHYKEQWLKDKSTTPFFLWLEKHEVSPYHKRMNFLTARELKEHELKAKKGLAYKGKKIFSTHENDETLFVITQKGEIICYPAGSYLRHPSASAGKPILGGGVLKVSNGVITELQSNSGHYLPNEEMAYQLLTIFKNKGFKIENDTPFSYFKDFKKIETTVGNFIKSYGASNVQQTVKKRFGL